jgi:uncharacterized protein
MEQSFLKTALTAEGAVAPAKTLVSARPVAENERIQTIDIIRGVALCGILLMNIPPFGIERLSTLYSLFQGSHTGVDWNIFTLTQLFFAGTMRALFSMLFGAGMVLFTRSKKEVLGGPTTAELYYRRLLFLVGFGLIDAYVFLWWGDILFAYGMLGMLLYPFRKLSAKWLLGVAFLCMGIGALKTQWEFNDTRETRTAYLEAVKAEKTGAKLSHKQQQDKRAWVEIQDTKVDSQQAKDKVETLRGNYSTVWQFLLPVGQRFDILEVYGKVLWDIVWMMFIGMAFLALGFFSNKLSTSSYLMGLIIGYGIGIPVGMVYYYKAEVAANVDIASFVDRYRVTPEVLYDVKRILLAIGHASLIILVFRSKIVPWLMKSFAAVGRMAFTNYLMQSILCTLFFFGYGLGYYNKLSFHQLYYVVGCVWVFQLITSAIWLKYFRFGPFEWAWRSLTYWKKQPMRIKTTSEIITE